MPFQNKNTQQDATRREFNDQKGIQRPEGNSTTRQRAPMGNPQLSSALNGQTDAPPETRGGAVRPMLPQSQEEGRSDRCFPRDKRRGGQTNASSRDKRRGREELLFKAVWYVLARAIKQGKKKIKQHPYWQGNS